jgi:hypothetical protein
MKIHFIHEFLHAVVDVNTRRTLNTIYFTMMTINEVKVHKLLLFCLAVFIALPHRCR